jgi:hypothetical protein
MKKLLTSKSGVQQTNQRIHIFVRSGTGLIMVLSFGCLEISQREMGKTGNMM